MMVSMCNCNPKPKTQTLKQGFRVQGESFDFEPQRLRLQPAARN